MDTFVVSDQDPRRLFSQELPNTAVTGHPYLSHVAPMALFNPTGSGKVVRVRRVDIAPLMAQSTTTPLTYDVYRTTAHTGTADAIAAVPLDSNNAALPSQVVLARRPATVTTSGVAVSVTRAMPLANDTRALGYPFATVKLSRILGRGDATTAEMQRITLREGEGMAVSLASACGLVYRFMVTLTVRVVATGACHAYTFPVAPDGLPLFSLLNGSSSGVVLEVVSLHFQQIGTDVVPQIAIEPIDGIGDGDTLTPVSLDSTNDIGTLIARRNCAILMRGAKAGALISVPHEHWMAGIGYGVGAGVSNLMGKMPGFKQSRPYPNEMDIVLREGEGLAITYKNAGSLGMFRHAITFTVSEAVYPAEADVRSGTIYGPNENDYTGTLVVSGGGNTYSRGRVVNA